MTAPPPEGVDRAREFCDRHAPKQVMYLREEIAALLAAERERTQAEDDGMALLVHTDDDRGEVYCHAHGFLEENESATRANDCSLCRWLWKMLDANEARAIRKEVS